jgi:IS6 family transposase
MHSLFRSTIRSSTAGRWTPAVPRSTSAAYPPAIAVLQAAGDLADNCQHRPVQYLNNVLEQDHRAIKRRINASQHFRSFWCAWRTIAGYEAIHMIRKGQAYGSAAGAKVGLVDRFILGLFAATN